MTAEELLKELEWSGDTNDGLDQSCPCCGVFLNYGPSYYTPNWTAGTHHDKCELAILIGAPRVLISDWYKTQPGYHEDYHYPRRVDYKPDE